MEKLTFVILLVAVGLGVACGGGGSSGTLTEGFLVWEGAGFPGTVSAPAMAPDGTIYVTDGAALHAVNPDGSLYWSYAFPEEEQIVQSSPAVGDDGTIFLAGYIYLYAIGPDGILHWKSSVGDETRNAPCVGSDGAIYVASANYLRSFDSTGALQWQYRLGASRSSPALGSNGVVHVGSDDGSLYAIGADGSLEWSYASGDAIESSPAIGSDGTVYVGSSDGGLYAVASDGTLEWTYLTCGGIESPPVIGPDDTVYVGSSDSVLYAIGADGTLRWSYTTGGAVETAPAVASDGAVYVVSSDLVLRALTGEGLLKWCFRVGNSVDRAVLLAPDGTIYLATGRDVCSVAGGSGPAEGRWPVWGHDALHTGRSGAQPVTVEVEEGRLLLARSRTVKLVRNASAEIALVEADAGNLTPTFEILDGSLQGDIVHYGDRSVTYRPPDGYTGSDSFQYRLHDSRGSSDPPATVSIEVIRDFRVVSTRDNGHTSAHTIDASGGYLYLGRSSLVLIYWMSDPVGPGLVRSVALNGTIDEVRAQGAYAYAATDEGLEIIDVSDPVNAAVVQVVDSLGGASSVSVSGSDVYVLRGEDRFTHVDVSDVANPIVASALVLSECALVSDISGSYAYAAHTSLMVIDVSDPAHPAEVRSRALQSIRGHACQARAVCASGQYLYLACSDGGGLQIFDLSAPDDPSLVNRIDVGTDNVSGVSVSGEFAYVSTGSGVAVVDVSDPAEAVVIKTVNAGSGASSVRAVGDYAYFSDEENTLVVIGE